MTQHKTVDELAEEYATDKVHQTVSYNEKKAFKAGFDAAIEMLRGDHDREIADLIEWRKHRKEASCVGCREGCEECRD